MQYVAIYGKTFLDSKKVEQSGKANFSPFNKISVNRITSVIWYITVSWL